MHLPAELVERKNDLLLTLRREMNGAVAGSMHDGGIDYSLNFGVSIPTIRTVAKRYAGDDELAAVAWQSGVRELRLAALFMATPDLLAGVEWTEGVDTYELAENYIWSLSRSADALTAVVSRLSASVRLLDRYMTLLAYARKAQWFAPETVEAACRAAEQSGEPALQRVVENIRITLEEQI